MKSFRVYRKYIVLFIIIIVILPILIDFFIIGNNIPSNISNSDWVTFLGSYTGALIGSVTTLVGLLVTLKFTKAEADEDRRLGLAPYFKYTMHERETHTIMLSKKQHDLHIDYFMDNDPNTCVNASVTLKNIGLGPVMDFEIFNIKYKSVRNTNIMNNKYKNENLGYTIDGSNDIYENGSSILMLIDIRMRLEKIENSRLIKNPPGSLSDFSPPPECFDKAGVLSMCIGYTDLIGNKYEQNISFRLILGCESDNGKDIKYSKPKLLIGHIEKSIIVS